MELLEKILTKDNLNKAYKKVYQNKGASGVINDKIKVTKKGKIKITKIGYFFDVH